MHKWLLLAALALAPVAWAGTPDAPELTDAVDDTAPHNGPDLVVPWGPALDLSSVWFTDDEQGLHAHIRVADLEALSLAEASASDFMWIAIWSPGYQEPAGAALRTGTWELRAEYRPLDDPAWHYWLERPCLDGDDSDGCAGPDRDIVDGLQGSVDMDTSTITVTAPWHHLERPLPGDGIHGLWATAQADYPAYPVRWVDWDTDEGDQCYRFRQVPTDQGTFHGPDDGPTGSSNGRAGFPRPYAEFGTCLQPPPSPTSPPSSPVATTKGNTTSLVGTEGPAEEDAAPSDAKESPGPGAILLPMLMGVALLRSVRVDR